MPFKGVTFSGQNVTPKNDGGLYASHHGDGILWGCSMAISGDDLIVQSGELIIGGRVVHVDGATNIDLSTRGGSPYIQVRVYADLSQSEGSQWDTTFVESSSLVFTPSLVQDDINYNGTKYEAELCVLQDAGGVLSIYRTMQYSPVTAVDDLMIDDGTKQLEGYVVAGGSGIRGLVGYGSDQGLYFPASGFSDAILYGNGGDIYVRPNGVGIDTNRFTFYANGDFRLNGQMLGGIGLQTGNALVTSVPSGEVTVAKVDTGLDATARYLVLGYFGGTTTNSSTTNYGSTDLELFVDGTKVRIESIFSNTSVAKFSNIAHFVIGASSSIELKVWTSNAYRWDNIVAQLQVIRLG